MSNGHKGGPGSPDDHAWACLAAVVVSASVLVGCVAAVAPSWAGAVVGGTGAAVAVAFIWLVLGPDS